MKILSGSRMALAALVTIWMGLAASPARAQEASSLDVSEATAYIGDWVFTIEGRQGPQDQDLSIKDVNGKVAAEISGGFGGGGTQTVTDISKSGDSLVLNYEVGGGGRGPFPVALTLTLDGETLKVNMSLGGGAFSIDGTGKKKM